ncbi:hypothetical protein SLEP1_g30718 [Rubroshorea leprosula]|uniref:RING-type E3 ubiquitin transferase n=1 Tax=Rubroshorea leprosula TaxID=152421 RepID=A0AAV5K127_9ROSI|nr:hypothetical protein SLEP1_g30718 [Rubroshorea leprosula]
MLVRPTLNHYQFSRMSTMLTCPIARTPWAPLQRGSSFTILYVAKEEANCTFKPVGSVIQEPKRFQFQKGWAQKFDQPEGGINLSLFKSDEIFKREGDVYPLVISAEICLPSSWSVPPAMGTSHGQITQAVLEKIKRAIFK